MTVRPTKVPGFPKVPASADPQTRQFLAALVEAVEIRLGRKGDPIDRAITLRELIESGLAKRLKETPFDPNNVGVTPPGIAPIVIATQPYAPTNLSVNGAFSQINIFWDPPFYQGHNQTEIWSHTSNVLGDATITGVATGFTFVDPVGSGVTRYYWVRFVNANGVLGPFNAVAGTVGVTAVDVQHMLTLLTDAVTEGQLGQALVTKLTGFTNDIDDLETTFGSTAAAATSAAAAIAAKVAALLAQTGAETAEASAEVAKTNAQTAQAGATTSQTAASNSATGAAGSASSAGTSATNAANSQNAAGTSANAAATSASSASTFATNAGTSATASQVSRLAANTASGNAASSASAAATSASNASASETAGGQSASASAASAVTANTKAGEASTFASNSATSATSASGSATAAASTVNGLTARLDAVGGTGVTVEQAYSANVSDIGDLEGQYTVKIDANGAVAGFGLASTTTAAGNITSEFVVNADRFAIMQGGNNSTTASVPFIVDSGVVFMASAMIKDATITSAKIGSVNADTINAGTLSANRIAAGAIDVNKLNLVGTGATINLASAASGARMVIQGSNIAVYDSSGALRVKLGAL